MEPWRSSVSAWLRSLPNMAFTIEKIRALAAEVQVSAKTMRAALAQLEMVAWFTWCDDGERRAAHVGCTRAARGLHGVLHGEHDGEHGGGREGRHLPPLQERLRVLANISAIEAISLVGEDSIYADSSVIIPGTRLCTWSGRMWERFWTHSWVTCIAAKHGSKTS